jgi:hypothetical protein
MKRRAIEFDDAFAEIKAHLTQPAQAVDVGDAYVQAMVQVHEQKNRAIAGEKAEGWRPIATAPKDGTEVLIFVPGSGEQFVAYWNKRFEAWLYAATSSGVRVFTKEATHWMPLPTPPTDGEG